MRDSGCAGHDSPPRVRGAASAWLAALACLGASGAWGQADTLQMAVGTVAQEAHERPQARLSISLTEPLALFEPPSTARDVGLQWRHRMPNNQTVDITAWRRINAQQPDALALVLQRDPLYGARVEMKLGPSKRRFATDYKFIGLQLDSGAKIGLRRKDGRPTIYYRSQF